MKATNAAPLCLAFVCMACACGGSSEHRVSLAVTLASPASTVYTRGIVSVQVIVMGGTPGSVELLRDSDVLVTLSPPYEYNWDTSGTAEGSYELRARATLGRQLVISEARTVVVDRTPPTIVSRTPGPGASNIFVDDPITVSFSKPLFLASINTGSISLASDSIPVAITPSLSSDGMTVTLFPQSAFSVPAILTATLTNAITDLAGNALAPSTWSWSVPDWVFLDHVLGQGLPAVTVNAMGKPMVAAAASGFSHVNLYVNQWTGTALQPVGDAINAVVGQDVRSDVHPGLSLDGTGKPVVAFSESDGTHVNAYVLRWTGTAWQAMGNPVNATGLDVHFVSLSLDGTGNPVLAFSESDGAHVNAYVVAWTGTAWQPVGDAINAVVGQDVRSDVTPGLSLDGTGKPVVAFSESDGTRVNAYVLAWTGTAWQAAGTPVNATGRDVCCAALSLDGTGKPVVAFSEFDGIRFNAYVQRWTGSAWQAVGSALNPTGWSVGYASLSLDRAGKPVVAFLEYDGTRDNVYVQRWTGSAWQSVGSALGGTQWGIWARAMSLDVTGKPVVARLLTHGVYTVGVDVWRSNQ